MQTQEQTNRPKRQTAKSAPSILLILGTTLLITGLIIIIAAAAQNSTFSATGIIIIGPIPIILGSGPNAQSLTLLAITLTALCIAATLLLNRRPKNKNS